MESLGSDLLGEVFLYLPGYEVAVLRRVYKKWNQFIRYKARYLWQQLSLQGTFFYLLSVYVCIHTTHLDCPFLSQDPSIYRQPCTPIDSYRQRLALAKPQSGFWHRFDPVMKPPSLQGGACATTQKLLIIYGGWLNSHPYLLNDIYALDTVTDNWFLVDPVGRIQGSYGHTLNRVFIPKKTDALILFGGMVYGGYLGAINNMYILEPTRPKESVETACCRPQGLEWKRVLPNGIIPQARSFHTTSLYHRNRNDDPKLYVFGGIQDEHTPITRLEEFNVADFTWTEPFVSGTEPCRRFGHSATIIGDRMFLAGGCTGGHNLKGPSTDGNELMDLHILHLDSLELRWSTPQIDRGPIRRTHSIQRCHTAVAVGPNIVFFGGGPSFLLSKQMLSFDTRTFEWKFLAGLNYCEPSERQSHLSALVGSRIYIYGGYNRHELGDCLYFDLDEPDRQFLFPMSNNNNNNEMMDMDALEAYNLEKIAMHYAQQHPNEYRDEPNDCHTQ